MKLKPLFLMLFVLIAGALVLAGCGSGSGDEYASYDKKSPGDEPEMLNLSEENEIEGDLNPIDPAKTEAERLAEIKKKEAELRNREQELNQRQAATSKPASKPAAPVNSAVPASKPKAAPTPTVVMVKLPELTELQVEFVETVSSETSMVGDPVRARVTQDIMGDGLVAIPAGSSVHGTVTEAVPSKKVGGQAMLAIRFDEIETPTGYKAAVQTSLNSVGKSQKGKDAATIGGATAGGAILGRILTKDKGKGTLLGGVIGAAAGTVAAHKNKSDPVTIDSGTTAVVALDLPVHIAVSVPDTPRQEALAENR